MNKVVCYGGRRGRGGPRLHFQHTQETIMLGSSLGSFSRVIKTETRMGSRLSPFAPTIIKPINFGTINNIHVFFQRGFFCSFLFQSSLLFQSCGMTCSMSAFGRCTMVRSFVAFIFFVHGSMANMQQFEFQIEHFLKVLINSSFHYFSEIPDL